MNSTNNVSARISFEKAREMFYLALRDKFGPPGMKGDNDCKAWVNQLKLTQGEVRFEVELNTTNNIYTFGVTPNQANSNNIVFPTERRLPLQDSICGTEMQITVCKPASRTSTAFQLRSFGGFDFTAAAAAALNSTFYSNGAFRMEVNNDVVVPYRGLQNFWYKPQTQQDAALGAGVFNDQFRGSEDGVVTLEPNLVLIGSKNNEPKIVLPSALAAVDEFTRVVVTIRGPYAQNSTVVN